LLGTNSHFKFSHGLHELIFAKDFGNWSEDGPDPKVFTMWVNLVVCVCSFLVQPLGQMQATSQREAALRNYFNVAQPKLRCSIRNDWADISKDKATSPK